MLQLIGIAELIGGREDDRFEPRGATELELVVAARERLKST
jgi:hypothetical protein